MLKKVIPVLIVLFVIGGVVYIKRSKKPLISPAPAQKEQLNLSDEFKGLEKNFEASASGFKRFIMDKEYFLCDIPEAWEFSKMEERKNRKGAYGLQVVGPRIGDAPTLARVTFYLRENVYFNGHEDFIESNSKDIFGDTKTETDTYGPVEKIKLNDRIAYRFESEVQSNVNPESKSGKFIMIKEKLYVVPGEKGFHVLRFMSSSSAYDKYLPIFEEMVYSFRGI
ncbi:MAG: hypothetical protein KAJ48_06510 [Elusimicrobiales bacterium]|nr:hypothetical protein [Elusimicrobiales bacterium]